MTVKVRKAEQYALVAYIIRRASEEGQWLGKKAFQKKMHLIQELGGVDAGYKFSFYTYGPYSNQLSGDLDVVANHGGATIHYDRSNNHYQIEPGEKTGRVIENAQQYIEDNRQEIVRVLDIFGNRLAKELELTSTIVYLREHTLAEEFGDDTKLVERVGSLKPKYSGKEIRDAIKEVRDFLAG